jgi:hypothetical protein
MDEFGASFPAKGPTGLPASLGITDRDSGLEKAVEAKLRMTSFVRETLPNRFDFDMPRMTLLSAFTRAQAFHDGALDALRADNPFSTFTLLRSYAENAAMLVYLLNKPSEIERFYAGVPREMRLRIGKLTTNASSRLAGFKGVYEQLSGFAHPAGATALSGWHAPGDDLKVQWSSVPAFKNDDDFEMACVWLVELAEANAHLWREVWNMYFGETPTFVAPEWTFGVSGAEAEDSSIE